MFFNHLTFFISAFALLLFVLRVRRHPLFERLLLAFTLIFFLSSTLWLIYNHYAPTAFSNRFIDHTGILIENMLLLLPVFALWTLQKHVSSSKLLGLLSLLLLINVAVYGAHLAVADGPLVFYPTNHRILINIGIQIGLDMLLFVIFIVLFKRAGLAKGEQHELFDGYFRTIVFWVFTTYYLQDIIMLLSFLLGFENIIVYKAIYYTSIGLNLLTAMLLVFQSIYVNWLKEFNALRLQLHHQSPFTSASDFKPGEQPFLNPDAFKAIKPINWVTVKTAFQATHFDLLNSIDSLEFLTRNEKLYAFLSVHDFENKTLSELLHVSIRTVETNLYRMRLKLRAHNVTQLLKH